MYEYPDDLNRDKASLTEFAISEFVKYKFSEIP